MSKILVVEDSPTIATGLRITLESQGYEVEIAEDGLAAFGALTRAKPSLILRTSVCRAFRAWICA